MNTVGVINRETVLTAVAQGIQDFGWYNKGEQVLANEGGYDLNGYVLAKIGIKGAPKAGTPTIFMDAIERFNAEYSYEVPGMLDQIYLKEKAGECWGDVYESLL